MKCPHCLVEVYCEESKILLGKDKDGDWGIIQTNCPNPKCGRMVLKLVGGEWISHHLAGSYPSKVSVEYYIRPKGISRAPVPPEVPDEFSEDYKEACLVLSDSPKASAALSRRCLQHILREAGNVKEGNLADEIQQVINGRNVPVYIIKSLDTVRNIGNFATHPIKSMSTGEVVAVEPGEAEWNLEVIETLFEFYFVQPAISEQKRTALNKKLEDAGKPPMK